MSSLHELLESIGRSGVGPLTRIIHEADTVRHNINGGQNLRQSYPKHRVLKPEAQAKEKGEIPSLALQA